MTGKISPGILESRKLQKEMGTLSQLARILLHRQPSKCNDGQECVSACRPGNINFRKRSWKEEENEVKVYPKLQLRDDTGAQVFKPRTHASGETEGLVTGVSHRQQKTVEKKTKTRLLHGNEAV